MSDKPIHVVKPSLPPIDEYIREIEDIWQTGWLTHSGPKHQALERELCSYLGISYTSLFCNGHMALEAVLSVLPLSGEVITTPFTFASTTQAIIRAGLTPVFCDIEPDTYTMCPKETRKMITEKTCAIMPVHVYGNLCDVCEFKAIGDEFNIPVIYDAAHAFGMEFDGRGVAQLGDITMFSFHATKVFNTIEGGALCYEDGELHKKFAAWMQFGMLGKEDAEMIGTNAKMNEFQAAMGLCNLPLVESDINKRKMLTQRYRKHLSCISGIELCPEQPNVKHNYAYFPIVFDPDRFGQIRDDVLSRLASHNIYPRKYFYPLTSDFSAYIKYDFKGETPIARVIADRVLTLPLYADLEIEDVDRVCSVILSN